MRAGLAAIASFFLIAALAAQSHEHGTIVGHVTLVRRVRGTQMPSNVYQPRGVNNSDADLIPEIKNVVVFLKGAPFAGPLPAMHEEIRQEREAFVPRVLPITRGSTVVFPNSDPMFHNVFSLSSAATFDLGRYPMGRSRAETFTKPGLVKVYCHIHSHMSASVLVLDNPYFATPDLEGTFTLPNLPAGSYAIVGWHERVGERSEPIQVAAGKSASVELSLPFEDDK